MDAEYKDMNESAPIPSLTLEPELENTPKLVVAEETKLQQTKVAEPVLTPQEQQMVDDFAQKIDVENTAQILQYGAGTQKKMADFSDAALANVRTQDLGEVGDLIVNVVGELKGFDAEEEKGFLGFFLCTFRLFLGFICQFSCFCLRCLCLLQFFLLQFSLSFFFLQAFNLCLFLCCKRCIAEYLHT